MNDLKKEALAFFVGALSYSLIIAAIKYGTGGTFGFLPTIAAFILGGVLGILAITPGRSIVKDGAFIAGALIALWSLLNPVTNIGDSLIVNKPMTMIFIAVAIIILEREVLNSLGRLLKKKEVFYPGFIGNIAILVILSYSGATAWLAKMMAAYWWLASIILLAWFTFIYFIITHNLARITKGIAERFGRP